MNLRYGGRRVSGFGVGAPDVIGPGIKALQTAVAQVSGEGGFTLPRPFNAVISLQAAGTAAVNAVGPAIDALSGNNPDVMRLTQGVWQQNKQLADVDHREGIGQADVDKAKKIVGQMVYDYIAAANLASSLVPKTTAATGGATASHPNNPRASRAPASASTPTAPPAPPTAPPDDSIPVTSPWLVPTLIGGAVLLVGGVALVAATRRAA